jgi:hypothetical protein
MKFQLVILLTLLTIPSFAQEIEKIIFTSQQGNERPTTPGWPKYTIEFTSQKNGKLIASSFYVDKKRKKLNDKVAIGKERVDKLIAWEKDNKKIFSQSDLGLDITDLKTQANHYELNFEVPPDLIVCVDSFQFCQAHKMTVSLSTGGETLAVTLIYKGGQKQEFIFDSHDMGARNFNIKNYILCYTLLADKIPAEVPSYGFFSKNKLLDIVLTYQKTVECEGYYYNEFTNKNPGLSAQDRRMMVGWNFVEYLEQRNK